MGRFQRGGRGGRTSGRSSRKSTSTTKKTKGLSDHMYYVGSAKQASDYVTCTNYIINYIRIHFQDPEQIATALEKFEEPDFLSMEPIMQISTATDAAVKAAENRKYEKQYEVLYTAFNDKKVQYEANKSKAHALLWQQCTSMMRSKITSRPEFETEIKGNPIKLLEAIKQHALSYESTQYRMKTICDAMKSLINLKQKEDENPIDYLKRFKVALDVFYSHVGKDFTFPRIVEEHEDYDSHMNKIKATDTSEAQKDTARNEIKKIGKGCMKEFTAYLYLENSDRPRYGSILKGLGSQFSLQNDQYPKTLEEAHNVIENHQVDNRQSKKKDKRKNDSSYQQQDQEDAPKLSFAQIKNACWCCGASNHKLNNCPKKESTPKEKWHVNKAQEVKQFQHMVKQINQVMSGSQAVSAASTSSGATASTPSGVTGPSDNESTQSSTSFWQLFSFTGTTSTTSEEDMANTMLLDSGSSQHLFCNRGWLQDVRSRDKPEYLQTNGGPIAIDQEGDLADFGTVPVNHKSLTNLLSLAATTDKYRVTFDSEKDNAFYVHTPRKVVRFGRNEANLYTHTPTQLPKTTTSKPPAGPMTMVQTVEENMKFHTPREVARAKKARDLMAALGFPSVADLKTAIAMNAIADLPVRTSDVTLAEKIFGPDLGSLKGKTTRQRPLPMVSDQITIPPQLYESRDALDLCIDIMFVNELPYFTTITKALYYRTAQFLPTRTHRDLYTALDEVLRVYNSNGFTID